MRITLLGNVCGSVFSLDFLSTGILILSFHFISFHFIPLEYLYIRDKQQQQGCLLHPVITEFLLKTTPT